MNTILNQTPERVQEIINRYVQVLENEHREQLRKQKLRTKAEVAILGSMLSKLNKYVWKPHAVLIGAWTESNISIEEIEKALQEVATELKMKLEFDDEVEDNEIYARCYRFTRDKVRFYVDVIRGKNEERTVIVVL